ncbi:MAG: N-6 DNA methylase [Acidovorax sp.]|nr:N-6 DNA methylase [Acidovorax sp.]
MNPALALRQASLLDEACPITAAVNALANAGSVAERGAICTRREVVEFVLDLCGYTPDRNLRLYQLLEPSFGDGDFLMPALERLLTAWRRSPGSGSVFDQLKDCLRGVELHRETYVRTKASVVARLIGEGIAASIATALADEWLMFGDFLLVDMPSSFDAVVGNPPYVRQELIPDVLMAEYRSRYTTIYDRADLYVPFIERSLTLLKQGGVQGFICADRWMKNRYGTRLRGLVADGFHLRAYIDMTDTPAFHADVIAYPAITVIAREKGTTTRVARRPEIVSSTLTSLSKSILSAKLPKEQTEVRELGSVAVGEEPWLLDDSAQMGLLRRLESEYPTLEDAGCKVGIGVATGADKAFIGKLDELDVEPDRKLPLVMTRDILSGRVSWRGYGVINPFVDGPGSGLVDLADYPRLRRYLEARKDEIASRHVAQKAPAYWYRTIDRITASLAGRPKLLVPDIKGTAQVVFEDGKLYPHHNLYYVTAEHWDLHALQAVLLSDVARVFIANYSTKMRGGFLRFQAQYLRRIRVPHWGDVPQSLREDLAKAAADLDVAACNAAAHKLYKLTSAESMALMVKST